MRSVLLVAVVAVIALVVTACGGGDDAAQPSELTNQAPETTADDEPEPEGETTTTAVETTTTEANDTATGLEDVDLRFDLLTFARGALFVSQTGMAAGSSGKALRMIDGGSTAIALSTDAGGPVVLLYVLPLATSFDRFAVPGVYDRPGNATFFKNVLVEGSSEGPDTGFRTLLQADLEIPGEDGAVTELVPDEVSPVRWVRLTLSDGIFIGDGDEGKTNLEFTELIGNGTQEQGELSTAFDGVWDLRLTERLDIRGTPLELHQTGASIVGCLDTIVIRGSVNGPIATATGIDPETDKPAAFIFVEDPDGVIQAAVSINISVFSARTALIDPDVDETPCSAEPPEPVACGSTIYVNFDLDSAVIRPESEQVLIDLFDQLGAEEATSVSIAGHTSTEGTVEYNQSLSERRAQAVVDDLIGRGYDAGAVSASGVGETSPLITPDDDETARSINRRVEIICS